MGVLAKWVFGLVAFLLFEQCAALSRDDPEVDSKLVAFESMYVCMYVSFCREVLI